MAWNSGTFSKAGGDTQWATNAAGANEIDPVEHDDSDRDFATGINSCLHKGGQNAATGNLNIGNFRLTLVGSSTALTDAPNAGQIQKSSLTWGGTSTGSSNAYAVGLTPAMTSYVAGMRVAFVTNFANTGTCTLDVDSVGAKTIKSPLGQELAGGEIQSGKIVEAIYDGTDFILITPKVEPEQSYTPTVTGNGSILVSSTTVNYARHINFHSTTKVWMELVVTFTGTGTILFPTLPRASASGGNQAMTSTISDPSIDVGSGVIASGASQVNVFKAGGGNLTSPVTLTLNGEYRT